MNHIIKIIAIFLASQIVHADDKSSCGGNYFTDSLLCYMETISWVEVTFQGDLLKQHKSQYEKLLRLRLRNDLSMISHDTVKYDAISEKYNWDDSKLDMKKRGALGCLVWTVGDDYPVAILTECKLWGYGGYRFSGGSEFEARYLAYGSKQSANQQVDEMLRGAVTQIAGDYLEKRDKLLSKFKPNKASKGAQ